MKPFLNPAQKQVVARIAGEPYQWLWKRLPNVDQDEVFFLFDQLKVLWARARSESTTFGLVIEECVVDSVAPGGLIVGEPSEIVADSLLHNNATVYQMSFSGEVAGVEHFDQEIDYQQIQVLSESKECIAIWIGPEFKVYVNGSEWPALKRNEVLREIKSKKGKQIMSMSAYRDVLDAHYKQYLKNESRTIYWHTKNKFLLPFPERIFQNSLHQFINDSVDCLFADTESVQAGSGRVDVRVITQESDVYIIEIKWIGHTKTTNNGEEWGLAGAFQTREYLISNQETVDGYVIAKGIYLLYDAHDPPLIPLDFTEAAHDCSKFAHCQIALVKKSPSVIGKEKAKAALAKKSVGK